MKYFVTYENFRDIFVYLDNNYFKKSTTYIKKFDYLNISNHLII